eukprot:1208570-Lingulodinium_polyedra.AAC.1
MSKQRPNFELWSWFAGTGHLGLTMLNLPFVGAVLFPVDLRYGWDVGHVEHQKLLRQVDETFRPTCATLEPRCKYWSRAGHSRDEQ